MNRPDRYIHTNGDVAANIDATKLGRAGFIAAASGYVLARIVGIGPICCCLTIAYICSVLVTACAGCEDEVVSRSVAAGAEIVLHHRVCGSVATYALSIAPPGVHMEGHADEYEPFLLVCDCQERERLPPVQMQVHSGNVIEVRYAAKRVWRVEKMRARQGNFEVRYVSY